MGEVPLYAERLATAKGKFQKRSRLRALLLRLRALHLRAKRE